MLSREIRKDKIVYKAWYRFTSDILNLENLINISQKHEVSLLTSIEHNVTNVNGKLVPIPLCGSPLEICIMIGEVDGNLLSRDKKYVNSLDSKIFKYLSSVMRLEIPSSLDLKVIKEIEDLIFRFGDPSWLMKSSPLKINPSSYDSLETQLEYLNDESSLFNKLRSLKSDESRADKKLKELTNSHSLSDYKKSIEDNYNKIEKEFSDIKSSNMFS